MSAVGVIAAVCEQGKRDGRFPNRPVVVVCPRAINFLIKSWSFDWTCSGCQTWDG